VWRHPRECSHTIGGYPVIDPHRRPILDALSADDRALMRGAGIAILASSQHDG